MTKKFINFIKYSQTTPLLNIGAILMSNSRTLHPILSKTIANQYKTQLNELGLNPKESVHVRD